MEQAQYIYDGFRNSNLDAGNSVAGPGQYLEIPVPAQILEVLEGRNKHDVDRLGCGIAHGAPGTVSADSHRR